MVAGAAKVPLKTAILCSVMAPVTSYSGCSGLPLPELARPRLALPNVLGPEATWGVVPAARMALYSRPLHTDPLTSNPRTTDSGAAHARILDALIRESLEQALKVEPWTTRRLPHCPLGLQDLQKLLKFEDLGCQLLRPQLLRAKLVPAELIPTKQIPAKLVPAKLRAAELLAARYLAAGKLAPELLTAALAATRFMVMACSTA